MSSPLHGPRLLRRMKKRRTLVSAKATSALMYQHLSLRLYFFSPPFVQLLDDGRCRKFLTLEEVLGIPLLTDLYHSDIVALDMTGTDEPDYLGTCEPAVCQHIAEAYFLSDGPADHLYGKVYLAHGVLRKADLDGGVLVTLYLLESSLSLMP